MQGIGAEYLVEKNLLTVLTTSSLSRLAFRGPFLLFRMGWSDAVMIDGYKHEWHIVCPSHLNVSPCLRQLGDAICQEIS